MVHKATIPVDQEITFLEDEIIVSKTDLKGRLTYANDVFCRVAEMSTEEVIGQPHSIIRHPDMPRSIFKFLWDSIQSKKEIFAHVKNMSKTGKYYWVIAHVTASIDSQGNIVGYHSNRRKPKSSAIAAIDALYKDISTVENAAGRKNGVEAGIAFIEERLREAGKTFDEYIWSLEG